MNQANDPRSEGLQSSAQGRAPGEQAADATPKIEAATEYVSLGFSILPLEGKKPVEKKWPAKGRRDPDAVAEAFRHRPDANVGILTGDLVVLDIDVKNDGFTSLEQLQAEIGPLPPTACVETGGGGRHYYFRPPNGRRVRCSQGILPGLDVRGNAGLVVAPPSIHPTTGREYKWIRHLRQGIAEIPPALLDRLSTETSSSAAGDARPKPSRCRETNQPGRVEGPPPRQRRNPARPASASPARAGRDRPDAMRRPSQHGNPEKMLAKAIERFPIKGRGVRHGQMVRLVGHFVGKGYNDQEIVAVGMGWWEHFHRLGRVRTDRPFMEAELRACLRSTRANRNFSLSLSEQCYIEAISGIRLTKRQRTLLKAERNQFTFLQDSPGREREREDNLPATQPHCRGGTQINRKLCVSESEERFVETLLVAVIHHIARGGSGNLLLTYDQICRIAAARFGQAIDHWDKKQVQRLKRKYVSRCSPDGQGRDESAEVFELLKLVRTGGRDPRMKKGRPSEYVPTGILRFLSNPDERCPSVGPADRDEATEHCPK